MTQQIEQQDSKISNEYQIQNNNNSKSGQRKAKSLKHIQQIADNSSYRNRNLPSINKNFNEKSQFSSQKIMFGEFPRANTVNPEINNSYATHKQPFELIQKRSPQQIQIQQIKRRRRKQFSQFFKPCYSTKKLQSLIQAQIREDKQKYPNKYYILSKEIGLTDKQIFSIKDQQLKYELNKYSKNIGLKYLRQHKQEKKHNLSKKMKTQHNSIDKDKNEEKKQKYLNYIPQVFGKLQPKEKIKHKPQNKIEVQIKNQKMIKLKQLQNKQEMLGKMILMKVKKHLETQKKAKKSYFYTVQSEQNIDDALIEFLKTKINRAQHQFK